MTAADKAFAEAERLIAKAKRTRATRLSLDPKTTRALTRLPDSIAGLTSLTFLSIDHTQVSDLTPLAGMVAMTTLRLTGTQVSDLKPLVGMVAMTELTLSSTPVSDLIPLAGMVGMTELGLGGTQVSDLKPLAGMVAMTDLTLSSTPVSDLTPLAGMAGMTQLSLGNTPVSDLTPLAGMVGMTWLTLNKTQVSDLTPLAGMAGMTVLYLTGTPVSDLTPLAGMVGMKTLFLDNTQVSDLTPLAGMAGMTWLFLENTPVSDLTPLAGMAAMTRLFLNNTQVGDLRVVLRMPKLATGPEFGGLAFNGTKFTQDDAGAAEIAEIKDPKARAAALFEYLKDWVPPGEVGEIVPDQDALLPVNIVAGRMEIAASLPTEAERDERLKRVLHQRICEKANDLARAAGNRFPRLAARARAVVLQACVPFEQLDLLLLHLDVEDLTTRQQDGQEDGETFPAEVTGPLDDVLRFSPGLTLGHPDVDLLNSRIQQTKANPPAADEVAIHAAMSRAVGGDGKAFGERLQALEQRMETLPADVAMAVQRAAHRNILWRFAVAVGLVGTAVAANMIAVPLTAFMANNWPVVQNLAQTYGPDFANWFFGAIQRVADLAGLVANIPPRPRR